MELYGSFSDKIGGAGCRGQSVPEEVEQESPQPRPLHQPPNGFSFDDMDDDIPFWIWGPTP